MSSQHHQRFSHDPAQVDAAQSAPDGLSIDDAVTAVSQPQLLFDEFPDGIAVFSRTGQMLMQNQAFQRLIAADQSEGDCALEGVYLRDFLADRNQNNVLIDSLIQDRVLRSFPLVFKAFDGRNINTEVSAIADSETEYFILHVREANYTKSPEMGRLHLSMALEALLPQPKGKGLLERVSAATEMLERFYIKRALLSANGNRAAAARELGLSRQSLYVKLNRYGISEPAS